MASILEFCTFCLPQILYSRSSWGKMRQSMFFACSQYYYLYDFHKRRGRNTIPTPKVNPNSMVIKFPSIELLALEYEFTCTSILLQFWVNGGLHSRSLPSTEAGGKDWICLLVGIIPKRWLKDRSNTSRIVMLASCVGISPLKELCYKSNDSTFFKFPKDEGIWLEKSLCDKLSICNALNWRFLQVWILQIYCRTSQLRWTYSSVSLLIPLSTLWESHSPCLRNNLQHSSPDHLEDGSYHLRQAYCVCSFKHFWWNIVPEIVGSKVKYMKTW